MVDIIQGVNKILRKKNRVQNFLSKKYFLVCLWFHIENSYKNCVFLQHRFRLDAHNLKAVFELCLNVFNDDSKYPNKFRRGVIERICLPALQHLNNSQLKLFYKTHVHMLTNHMKERLNEHSSDERFEIQLINKICCFKMASLMYELLGEKDLSSPTSEIVLAFDAEAKKGKELTAFLSRLVFFFSLVIF